MSELKHDKVIKHTRLPGNIDHNVYVYYFPYGLVKFQAAVGNEYAPKETMIDKNLMFGNKRALDLEKIECLWQEKIDEAIDFMFAYLQDWNKKRTMNELD